MRLPAFKLHRPTTVEAALGLLAEHGEAAMVYMGGTELLLLMKLGFAAPDHLVDCKRVPGLSEVTWDGDVLAIGAGVTHRELENHPLVARYLPALGALERSIANVRVRNAGTLGGNLCFAEPHSDPATLLIAVDAQVELASTRGFRRVPLADFIVGPVQTSIEPGQLMTRVLVPAPPPPDAAAFERIAFRERPVANVAVAREGGAYRVVVGAAGPRPMRASAAERLLEAGGPAAAADAGVAAGAAAQALADLDGAADFKQHLVAKLLERAVARLAIRV